MNLRFASLVVTFALMTVMISCGGGPGGIDTPTTPPVSMDRPAQAAEAGHYVLAFIRVYVNPEHSEATVVPMRQIADHWNVLKWLEQGPCTNCVAVTGVTTNPSGTKSWDVEIRHPFPIANLTGFDVRGIAMFRGSREYPAAGLTTPDMSFGDGELVNADGYTTLYNATTAGSGPGGLQGYIKGKFGSPLIPDATLNGYKRHISEGAENTRNAMYAGDTTGATYELSMPQGTFYFNYCVDASWLPPSVKPVVDPMTDFPPEANCAEAWNIEVAEHPVGDGLTTEGGQTVLELDIYDWQANDGYSDPVVECPELFSGTVTAAWLADQTGFATWEATITNSAGADAGEYEVLISAEANENASAPDWLNLTAYQIVTVEVAEAANEPPTAGGSASTYLARPFFDVTFIDNSTDPDGASDIEDYEWDFSYDSGDGFLVESTEEDPTYQFPAEGVFQVQHRVRDSAGNTDILDAPLEVKVERFGWGVTWGGEVYEECTGMESTPEGNAYVLGITEGTVDLDPGAGVDNYTSAGNKDFILSKFDTDGNYLWGHGWGSTGLDVAKDVAGPTMNQVLITGSFTGTVDFDPGSGVQNRTSDGAKEDAFLLILDPNGNFTDVKTWGGNNWEGGEAVGFDSSNNVYVAGYFYGTVDFNPGGTPAVETSNGGSDVFLMKYGSGGAFEWVVSFGGVENDWALDLVVDATGNVALCGYFQSTVDFDPSGGTDERTSAGDWDAYVCKFASDGSYQWTATWGGSGRDQAKGAGLDDFGNIGVTGGFTGTVDFNPGGGTDNHTAQGLYTDIFVSLFNAIGAFQWAQTWGETDAGDSGESIHVQSSGLLNSNIYVVGQFFGTVDFDPGGEVDEFTSAGLSDSFVALFDSTGMYGWASTWGGDGVDSCIDVGLNAVRKIYVAGHFTSTTDLDPSPGIEPYASAGNYDIFLSKLDSDGWW